MLPIPRPPFRRNRPIIEVKDLDEAIERAVGPSDAEWGSVEIRPIVEWER